MSAFAGGRYGELHSGVTSRALRAMTGDMVTAFAPKKLGSTAAAFWQTLLAASRRGDLMSAAIHRGGLGAALGWGEARRSDGLIAGHAYAIIAVEEVDGLFKLLRLRNPWGKFEWKGEWSRENSMWERHPQVAKQVSTSCLHGDDGDFWMPFDRFCAIFSGVDICHLSHGARDLRLRHNEDAGLCGLLAGCLYGCACYWCACQGCRFLYCSWQQRRAPRRCCACLAESDLLPEMV